MRKSMLRFAHALRLLCLVATLVLFAGRDMVIGQATPPPDRQRPWFTEGDMVTAASERPRASLDEIVNGLSVQQATIPEVLQYLFNRDHLIVGIELIRPALVRQGAPSAGERRISGSFGPGPLRAILDEVVGLDPEFVWLDDGGVANLVARANLEDGKYAFNRSVEAFDVDDLPFARALESVLLIQQHDLDGWPWGFGLRRDPDACPCVTIHLGGATLRELLNEIAWQSGLAWRVTLREGDRMMGLLITAEFDEPGEGCTECPETSAAPSARATETLSQATRSGTSSSPGLLPLRGSLVPHGFAFAWDPAGRRAWASNGRTRLSVGANDVQAFINGDVVTLGTRPTVEDGRVLVPPALITLILNAAGRGSATSPGG